MLDIVVVFMRVTNRTWPANDIIDVHPITSDPGPGVSINPKHAIMVIRNVPVDSFARVKALLTQINLLDDGDPLIQLDRRRWFFRRADLPAKDRNAIRNQGRLDIDWADIKLVCIRKPQGAVDTRPIRDTDVAVVD